MKDKTSPVTCYQIDDLTLDTQRGNVTRAGDVISLPKLSYDLLVALASAAPALLSQQALMQAVWPERVIGDETLKQRIKLLRKALDDDANAPRYIEAVRGRGYRLVPEVKRAFVAKQPPAVMLDLTANDLFPSLSSHQYSRTWRRFSWLGLSLFFISLFLFTSKEQPEPIVVNKGKHALSQVNSEKESPKTTSGFEKIIANQAQVYYSRGREYYHRYHQGDNEIAMDFFSKAIAEQRDFVDAYAALSQAHSQQFYQFSGTDTNIDAAINYAYNALALDGRSANAYKALGTAFYVAGWLAKSVDALLKAQSLAPQNKEILSALAFIYSRKGQYNEAIVWHEKVLKLHPDYALAHAHFGQTLMRLQRNNAAKRRLEKSLSLQPDYIPAIISLASVYRKQGAIADAENLLLLAIEQFPKQSNLHAALVEHYYHTGNIVLAEQTVGKAAILYQKPLQLSYALQAVMTTKGALREKLTDALVLLQQKGNSHGEVSLALAAIHLKNGKPKLALRYMVQAYQQGLPLSHELLQSELFTALKELSAYQSLLSQYQHKTLDVAAFALGNNNL